MMMFVYVLMRYVFYRDFPGFEELLRIPMFWLYFMGASYGSLERSHISADMVDTFVKYETIQRVIKFFVNTLAIIALIVLVCMSFQYVTWNIYWNSSTPTYKLPMVTSQGALLIGFVLMLYFDICHYIADIKEFMRKRRETT
jgi:TRAP-type C4-dicarboxylate transport system permease small subunit